jgi:hypothetical protein
MFSIKYNSHGGYVARPSILKHFNYFLLFSFRKWYALATFGRPG